MHRGKTAIRPIPMKTFVFRRQPPDLDCGEIEYDNFTVREPDLHRFDGDNDGIGCES